VAEFLAECRERGIVTIGDAKRGDIGSTMSAYAHAWLSPGADFEVDALTVTPYLGVGALEPALELAATHDKGLFVLAATSNPEAWSLQSAIRSDGHTVAGGVVADVVQWCDQQAPDTTDGIGFVVGATIETHSLGLGLDLHPVRPILAPGYGAQGAVLGQHSQHFPNQRRLIAVVARSVLTGGPQGFVDRVQSAVSELVAA